MKSATAINRGPVFQAGLAKTIVSAQTTLPSMRGTLAGWAKPIVIGVVTTTIASEGDNDGQAQPSVRDVRTSGVLQPGDAEKLEIGAEGERSWANWVLHVYPQLDVPTDTRLQIEGKFYRVTGRTDYNANGFIRYDLAEDYTDA